MEDLEGADTAPVENGHLPEGNDDPQDPSRPEIEEEDATNTPPMAAPTMDMEENEDIDEDAPTKAVADDDDSDDELLSEVDEAQFEDFDPNAIALDERRVVDANDVAQLGKHKRKRTDGDGESKKKRKEGRRDKPRKRREGDDGADGEVLSERRARRQKEGGERKKKRTPSIENDENLTPEERRRKAFDRQLDEALKKPKTARRRGGIDLEAMADNELEDMRRRMAEAAQADTVAREAGKPAMYKLKMLPEVVALLNRNTLQSALVDPEINILESVRFFLEPLNDGSLPAYNIQRELLACLAKLPIGKDALVASGIGKVTHFYTRTTKAEPAIRRQAERLVGDWTRPILKRSDDYRKRELQTADYDPTLHQPAPAGSADRAAARAAAARKAALAAPGPANRARVEGGVGTYSIVPRSDMSRVQAVRKHGATGEEVMRRLKARHAARR